MAMRFEVPQFIDVKDKIFGPFTLTQFIFIAGGAGLAYLVIRLVPTFFRYIVAIVPVAFGLALAFYKVNGRPFAYIVQSFILYLFSTKLFLWRQRTVIPKKVEETKPSDHDQDMQNIQEARLSDSRLRDLAWNLDILEDGK